MLNILSDILTRGTRLQKHKSKKMPKYNIYVVVYSHLDERTIEIIDGTLLDGWSKQLVARKDLSKYDMYIVRYV